ncbi:dienelactone hydrolase family protein [Paucibacter sp. DJ1R-11]|uniref:dienelactone hydrolase family protein n=1 Tax=Paucibacter sp. DJ1R-11 TaxID=2893556 RepID=UPI0021E4A010|nr:dienelactone hydrolase family protein [Paucibacter sp. DJ1R-11]MCV2364207.1 dienelactone hydrolase family protein [Paucibacter sp. DJ1R-11]
MGQMIEFQRPDGAHSPAYLATASRPDAPGLILLQEWWGLNENIRATADRYAAAGFHTLAPDLYRGRQASDADEASHLMSGLSFADATHQDLTGALRHLREACGSPQVGVSGFCMGGALTVAAAVHVKGLSAASCFYGIPPADFAAPQDVKIPFQGHYADIDDWCTPTAVRAFVAQLPPGAEIHHYPAAHGFFNSSRAHVFDAACAELAWQRTLAFLRAQLC